MTAMIIPLAEEAIARRIKRLYDAVYTIESCFGVEISAHKELLPTQYIDAPALAYRMAQVGRLEAGHCMELLSELEALIKESKG